MKLSAAFEASIALSFGDVSDAYQFFPSTLGISDNPDYRANLQHCRITDIDYKRNHAGVSDHVLELSGVVARAPSTKARVEADLPGIPIFPSLAAMIEAGGIDAVTITTPPETRRELVLEALDAGLHVIPDKPFAPPAEGGRELAAAAKRKGLVLGVYHNRRLDADIQTLRKTRTSSFPRVSRWRLCHSKEPSARDRKMRDFCQGFRALGSMDRDLVWLYCVIEDVVRQILGETRLRSRGPTRS